MLLKYKMPQNREAQTMVTNYGDSGFTIQKATCIKNNLNTLSSQLFGLLPRPSLGAALTSDLQTASSTSPMGKQKTCIWSFYGPSQFSQKRQENLLAFLDSSSSQLTSQFSHHNSAKTGKKIYNLVSLPLRACQPPQRPLC